VRVYIPRTNNETYNVRKYKESFILIKPVSNAILINLTKSDGSAL